MMISPRLMARYSPTNGGSGVGRALEDGGLDAGPCFSASYIQNTVFVCKSAALTGRRVAASASAAVEPCSAALFPGPHRRLRTEAPVSGRVAEVAVSARDRGREGDVGAAVQGPPSPIVSNFIIQAEPFSGSHMLRVLGLYGMCDNSGREMALSPSSSKRAKRPPFTTHTGEDHVMDDSNCLALFTLNHRSFREF
jgi:hypothetical protein